MSLPIGIKQNRNSSSIIQNQEPVKSKDYPLRNRVQNNLPTTRQVVTILFIAAIIFMPFVAAATASTSLVVRNTSAVKPPPLPEGTTLDAVSRKNDIPLYRENLIDPNPFLQASKVHRLIVRSKEKSPDSALIEMEALTCIRAFNVEESRDEEIQRLLDWAGDLAKFRKWIPETSEITHPARAARIWEKEGRHRARISQYAIADQFFSRILAAACYKNAAFLFNIAAKDLEIEKREKEKIESLAKAADESYKKALELFPERPFDKDPMGVWFAEVLLEILNLRLENQALISNPEASTIKNELFLEIHQVAMHAYLLYEGLDMETRDQIDPEGMRIGWVQALISEQKPSYRWSSQTIVNHAPLTASERALLDSMAEAYKVGLDKFRELSKKT